MPVRDAPLLEREAELGVKTVETHLSHAYRRLDIRLRPELPARLARVC